ncbi:hypothetical protein JVT61DRAFT_3432 [Boletus reticuloceps]|uniref:Uncharacterized protein n=1 Tax=Boletus reticuloceps TaxID=495285 RepID=A0A8I2YLY3_9AGAM|nr:hypothetical protein JVT61DRAFT_3432 [Boletus reticuloceps]
MFNQSIEHVIASTPSRNQPPRRRPPKNLPVSLVIPSIIITVTYAVVLILTAFFLGSTRYLHRMLVCWGALTGATCLVFLWGTASACGDCRWVLLCRLALLAITWPGQLLLICIALDHKYIYYIQDRRSAPFIGFTTIAVICVLLVAIFLDTLYINVTLEALESGGPDAQEEEVHPMQDNPDTHLGNLIWSSSSSTLTPETKTNDDPEKGHLVLSDADIV